MSRSSRKKGIITVTTGDISVKDVEVDEDLKALNDIPRIRKHHDDPNPFDLGSIISVLSINPNTRGVDSKIRLEQAGIDSDALYNAMFVYQEHLKSCSQEIGNEQSDIYEQMHSTNALSGKMLGLMKARVERAQMEQEQLQGMSLLETQLHQTEKHMQSIMRSLLAIEEALPQSGADMPRLPHASPGAKRRLPPTNSLYQAIRPSLPPQGDPYPTFSNVWENLQKSGGV